MKRNFILVFSSHFEKQIERTLFWTCEFNQMETAIAAKHIHITECVTYIVYYRKAWICRLREWHHAYIPKTENFLVEGMADVRMNQIWMSAKHASINAQYTHKSTYVCWFLFLFIFTYTTKHLQFNFFSSITLSIWWRHKTAFLDVFLFI